MYKLVLVPLFTLLFVISTISVSAMPDDNSMIHNKKMMDHSASIPIYIPLTMGYVDGNEVFYISTEASIEEIANDLTDLTGFPVTYTPALKNTPKSTQAQIYVFSNGIEGIGTLGFQPNVADSEPGDEEYSPLWNVNIVTWAEDVNIDELKSEDEIQYAITNGKLSIKTPGLVVNCPFIKWSDGQMQIRENKTLTDDTPYGGGQILEINTEEGYVVIVGHKGYFENKVIFYIATDASAEEPAEKLGIPFVSKLSETLFQGSSDLVVFTNGIEGVGPAGFQPSIGSTNIGDDAYSPLWRISKVTWSDDVSPIEIMSFDNVSTMSAQGDLTISTPTFVVNCPFIDVKALYHDKEYRERFGKMIHNDKMMHNGTMMMDDDMMMMNNGTMMMDDDMMMMNNGTMMMDDDMMMMNNGTMMMDDDMMMMNNGTMMMDDDMMMMDNGTMMMDDDMMMMDNGTMMMDDDMMMMDNGTMMMDDDMMMMDNGTMMMDDDMMMMDNGTMMMDDDMMMMDNGTMMMDDDMMMMNNGTMMMDDDMMMMNNGTMMMDDDMMMMNNGTMMMDDDMMMKEIKSPKKQMEKYQVKAKDVICANDKELAFRTSNNSAVCLTPTSAEILTKRGIVTQ